MTHPLVDPIGEPDRQLVIRQLRLAAEAGRLSPHELDSRVAAARSARTAADLGAATPADGFGAATGVGALGAAGYRVDDPLVLSGGFTRERRDGVWVVPPFVRASAVAATVRIDCLQATAAEPVIDLSVSAGAATVLLVVPDGWAVNTDRLGKGLGRIVVKVAREPEPGCPIFLVHGNVGIGRFKARPASRLERWRHPTG